MSPANRSDFNLPRVKYDRNTANIDMTSLKAGKRDCVTVARGAFDVGRTKDLSFRREQLKNLLRMYDERAEDILQALCNDLGLCRQEGILFEIEFLKNDLRNVLYHLNEWSKPERRYNRLLEITDDLSIYKDPFGVVLICGDWNFPFHTCLMPLAGAIASGNCAIIQPSKRSKSCAQLISKILQEYLDNDCYHVEVEDIDLSQTNEKFDYIFYIGKGDKAKQIHQQSARSLTPTTFILRGKNPVYIDDSADIEMSVRRILWGKCINAGQTSIAPGYILCTRQVQEAFVAAVPKIIQEFYGPDPLLSNDFARIVDEDLFLHLSGLLKDKKVAYGGKVDFSSKYIEPTILVDVSPNDAIMYEDVSGPILPILNIQTSNEAITFINARDKPLCMYIFSNNYNVVETLLRNTSSGGVTVNDTIVHAAAQSLPIGGVGLSGIGKYHAKATFETFTHEKSVLKRPLNILVEKIHELRYPPYNALKTKLISLVMLRRPRIPLNQVSYVFVFILGLLCTYLVFLMHDILQL